MRKGEGPGEDPAAPHQGWWASRPTGGTSRVQLRPSARDTITLLLPPNLQDSLLARQAGKRVPEMMLGWNDAETAQVSVPNHKHTNLFEGDLTSKDRQRQHHTNENMGSLPRRDAWGDGHSLETFLILRCGTTFVKCLEDGEREKWMSQCEGRENPQGHLGPGPRICGYGGVCGKGRWGGREKGGANQQVSGGDLVLVVQGNRCDCRVISSRRGRQRDSVRRTLSHHCWLDKQKGKTYGPPPGAWIGEKMSSLLELPEGSSPVNTWGQGHTLDFPLLR